MLKRHLGATSSTGTSHFQEMQVGDRCFSRTGAEYLPIDSLVKTQCTILSLSSPQQSQGSASLPRLSPELSKN